MIIDERLADGNAARYRMTVAEELGHLVLHPNFVNQVGSVEEFCELQQHEMWYYVERNAKRFAAAILMPGNEVVKAAQEDYPKLVRTAGYGHVGAIERHLVHLLAKRFEVSQETMRYRLREWTMKVLDRMEAAIRDRLNYLD